MINLKFLGAVVASVFFLASASSAFATGSTANSTCASIAPNFDIDANTGGGHLNLTVAKDDRVTFKNNTVESFTVTTPAGAVNIPANSTSVFDVTAAQAGDWYSDRVSSTRNARVSCEVGGAIEDEEDEEDVDTGDLTEFQKKVANGMTNTTINNIIDGTGQSIQQSFFGGGENNADVGNGSASAYFSTNGAQVLSALDTMADDGSASHQMNLWSSIAGNYFDSVAGPAFNGMTGTVAVGGDKLVTENILLGALLAGEIGSFTGAPALGLDGIGGTVGVYGAALLTDNLVLSGTLSNTWLAYSSSMGAATGSFTANRFAASASLSGEFDVNSHVAIAPTLVATYTNEQQAAYVLSNAVPVPAMSINSAVINFGSTFYYTLDPNALDMVTRLSLSLMGDYAYSSAAPPAVLAPVVTNTLSARVGAGIDTTLSTGATLGAKAEMGGIGSNVLSYGGSASLSVPL